MSNRLAAEKSPYLRQHAENPVDWYPWSDEALARARTEQKPIFLSIGYSTCHWCHVMAHESFENRQIAESLNRDFIPIKVDREERPDLDRIYMTYVQQTTGHGGWPMSVWLTPDGKPFYGGTYFPPDDRHGRPGFAAVLNAIARHWQEDRAKIETGAEEVVASLRRYGTRGVPREVTGETTSAVPLHEAAGDAFEKCYQYFHEAHDDQWGGFGGAPKFPRASVINFLFRIAALQGVESELGAPALKMAGHTLQKMAEGGLHDHVGGGFHRYSVDEQWFVPHFEKMLYDEAQIALNYLEAKQATGREVFAWLARDIFHYVQCELTSPSGGFYSAEDADSAVPETGRTDSARPEGGPKPAHAEGAFYVWTKDEIDAALGSDAPFFCAHFGIEPEGNVVNDPQGEFTGKNVVMQRQSLVVTARDFGLEIELASGKLLDCLQKLKLVRDTRPRPHLDDKVITAWNGLMISALAKGHQVLADEGAACLTAATRSAEFIERELYDVSSGVLYRSWREGRSRVEGFAEDYAYLVQGLLDLYEAGFEIRWLRWAVKLQATMDSLFWDADHGGYFNSRADDLTVIARLKEDYDGAEPAPNSVAVMNLMRLDWMLGIAGAREKAFRTIEILKGQWSRAPHALPQLLCAFELALTEPRTVVLAGDTQSPEFRALAAVLHERLGLRRAILAIDDTPRGAVAKQWLGTHRAYLADFKSVDGKPAAYVCENFTCQRPVCSAADLRSILD